MGEPSTGLASGRTWNHPNTVLGTKLKKSGGLWTPGDGDVSVQVISRRDGGGC